jgi:hypothetical protein
MKTKKEIERRRYTYADIILRNYRAAVWKRYSGQMQEDVNEALRSAEAAHFMLEALEWVLGPSEEG